MLSCFTIAELCLSEGLLKVVVSLQVASGLSICDCWCAVSVPALLDTIVFVVILSSLGSVRLVIDEVCHVLVSANIALDLLCVEILVATLVTALEVAMLPPMPLSLLDVGSEGQLEVGVPL